MARGIAASVAWLLLIALLCPLPESNGQTQEDGRPGANMQVDGFSAPELAAPDCCPYCKTPYDEPLDEPVFQRDIAHRWLHVRPLLKHRLPSLFGVPTEAYNLMGRPLQRESWLYRPFSAGWFMGMVQGGPLIDDWVGQQRGFLGGYRFGWDSDFHWGGEMRFAFGSVRLFDSDRAKQARWDADTQDGFTPDDPWRQRFDRRRDADLNHWDLDVLYYPWGDTQWRPYLMAGLGTAQVSFIDRLSQKYDKTVLAMPLAIGMKCRCNDWLALRLECTDNIAFGGGSGFNTLHNLSFTAGLEVRFGGARKAYWPWNPGRCYW